MDHFRDESDLQFRSMPHEKVCKAAKPNHRSKREKKRVTCAEKPMKQVRVFSLGFLLSDSLWRFGLNYSWNFWGFHHFLSYRIIAGESLKDDHVVAEYMVDTAYIEADRRDKRHDNG
jgi:hypothetical protein